VNRVGLSRKHIFDAVEASVKRLGTFIDVLQIHRLDRDTPREEIMRYSLLNMPALLTEKGAE
jgi:versiconal hemiacetal acetate reductase